MFKIILAWLKGGKTNTAMVVIVLVYALKKWFGVETNEAELTMHLAVILGSIGQLHKIWKSDLIHKIIENFKKKKAEVKN